MKFNYVEWIKGCDFTDPSVCVEKIKELVLTEGLEAEQVMYGFHLVNEKNLNRLYRILKNDNKENKSKKEQKSKLKEQLDIVSRENSIIKKELAKMGLSFKELMKKGLSEEEALIQARVARILRASDYDFKARQPIPWKPKEM